MRTGRKQVEFPLSPRDQVFEELLRRASSLFSGTRRANPVAGKLLIKPDERDPAVRERFRKG